MIEDFIKSPVITINHGLIDPDIEKPENFITRYDEEDEVKKPHDTTQKSTTNRCHTRQNKCC